MLIAQLGRESYSVEEIFAGVMTVLGISVFIYIMCRRGGGK